MPVATTLSPSMPPTIAPVSVLTSAPITTGELTTSVLPSASPMSSTTAQFSLSLAGNFETLLATSRSALEVSLRQDLGRLWNVSPDQVTIVSLVLEGSLLVSFTVSSITEAQADAGRLAAISRSPTAAFSDTYALYTGPANGSPSSSSSSFGLNSLSAPSYSASPTSNGQSTTNVGLYVGISVGVAVLVGIVVGVLAVRNARRKKEWKAQLERFDDPVLQAQEMNTHAAEKVGML